MNFLRIAQPTVPPSDRVPRFAISERLCPVELTEEKSAGPEKGRKLIPPMDQLMRPMSVLLFRKLFDLPHVDDVVGLSEAISLCLEMTRRMVSAGRKREAHNKRHASKTRQTNLAV